MSAPLRRMAVVSGAASGIGLASARSLLGRGVPLIGIDVVGMPRELEVDDRVDWVRGDVSRQDTWDRALHVCHQRDSAGPDCLIACAGTIVVAPFLETAIDDWQRLFEVNVLGVVRGMRTLIPAMIERHAGAVAVVCSVNSLFVEEQMSAYSASKAALLSAVRSASLEAADKGVRINAVCPGIVETPLLRRHFETLEDPEAARHAGERRTPLGRLITATEVAEALCFLVSDSASGFSGAALTVDGGLTIAYDFDASTVSDTPDP